MSLDRLTFYETSREEWTFGKKHIDALDEALTVINLQMMMQVILECLGHSAKNGFKNWNHPNYTTFIRTTITPFNLSIIRKVVRRGRNLYRPVTICTIWDDTKLKQISFADGNYAVTSIPSYNGEVNCVLSAITICILFDQRLPLFFYLQWGLFLFHADARLISAGLISIFNPFPILHILHLGSGTVFAFVNRSEFFRLVVRRRQVPLDHG